MMNSTSLSLRIYKRVNSEISSVTESGIYIVEDATVGPMFMLHVTWSLRWFAMVATRVTKLSWR